MKHPATGEALSRRSGQIDALRIIAVTAVLFDHFGLVLGHGPIGRLGVQFFLVISGYMISLILLRGQADIRAGEVSPGRVMLSFYVRRGLRILPAFYIALAVTWWLHRPDFAGSLWWHALFGSNILFAITNQWGPPWELAHLWTLSLQEQFYLIWPLVLLFLPHRWLGKSLIVIALCGLLFRVGAVMLGLNHAVGALTLLPGSITALCAGSGLAILETKKAVPRWLAEPGVIWPSVACAAFALANLVNTPGELDYLLLEDIWLVPLVALLYAAKNGIAGPVGRALDLKVLQYLGRISLGVYLYQFIALDVVSHIFPWLPRKGPVLVALIAMTAVGLAMISWHLVEKPIGSLKAMANYKAHRVRTRSLTP